MQSDLAKKRMRIGREKSCQKRGYGAKRLRDLAYEVNECCDDMTLEKTTNSELIDLLDSEIKGLDTRKMLEDVQRWGDKKMRERAGEIRS